MCSSKINIIILLLGSCYQVPASSDVANVNVDPGIYQKVTVCI